MKKVLLLLLFLTFTKCKNTTKMNIKSKDELNFEITYKQSVDSIPILSKDNKNEENSNEYSRINISNPELSFPKTYMELYGSSQELIGRYVSENGNRDNYFFSIFNDNFKYRSSDSNIVDLLITESGDFLKLTPDFIYIVKKDFSKIQYPLKGMKIMATENKDIWVVGINNAWLIEDEYNKIKLFAWNGGINTISNNNTLNCLNKSKDTIISLDKNGILKLEKTLISYGNFENLVGAWGSKHITLEGSTFRWYDGSKIKGEIALQSAGILNNGELFVSYTKNKKTYLISNTISKQWKLPENFKNHILPITFEKENAYVGYNLNTYCEFIKNGEIAESLKAINESQYGNIISPYRWKIGQSHYFNIPSFNKLIVSIVGSKEIILFEINSSF